MQDIIMQENNLRNLIDEVTTKLVQSKSIFNEDDRNKYFQYFISPTKPPFVTFHEMEIHQDEHPNTDQITSRFKIYGDLPIQDWFTKLTARQKIENITVAFITQYQWSNYIKHTNILPTASFKILICIFFSYFVAKVTSLKCVSSKKLQQYDPIVALRGDLLVWNLGYELYKCYGSLYNGILIFNLGHDFGYMWFCTKDYIAEPQSMMMLHSTEPNSELAIIEFNNVICPIVYATKPIKTGEYIYLSNKWIREKNMQFSSWIQNESCQ